MDEVDREGEGKERRLRGFFSYPCLYVFKKICCVKLEKVEVHGDGDFQDQVAVERRFVKDFVDMVAGAMDFARQPAHATLVGLQLLVDEVSDVDVAFVVFHCLGGVFLALFPFSNEKA